MKRKKEERQNKKELSKMTKEGNRRKLRLENGVTRWRRERIKTETDKGREKEKEDKN